MSYAIIRMQKFKQGDIKGLQFHHQRERESQTNPDIIPGAQELNYDLVNNQNIDYNKIIEEKIAERVARTVRRDAVIMCEFLITSDREFFEELTPDRERKFFETALDFVKQEYGEQNVIHATVHKDEMTPHMHCAIVPITEDGRLSAKEYFGKRQQLIALQDNFQKYMVENGFELKRGISSSRRHVEMGRMKAEGVLENTKVLESDKKSLESEIDTLKREIMEIYKEIHKVDEIEAVEKHAVLNLPVLNLLEQGTVRLRQQDVQDLKQWAKESIVQKQEMKQWKERTIQTIQEKDVRIQELESEIEIGKQENTRLAEEYKKAKETSKTWEQLYEVATDSEKEIRNIVKQAGLYEMLEQFQKRMKEFRQIVERYFQKRPQRTVHVLKEMVAKVYPRFSRWNPTVLEKKEKEMAVLENTDHTLYFREGHSLEKVKEYCVDALVNKKRLQEGYHVDISFHGETFQQIWRQVQYQEQQFRKEVEKEFEGDAEKVVNRLEQMVEELDPSITEIQYAFSVKKDKSSPVFQEGQKLIKGIGYRLEQYKEAYLERLAETPVKELPKVWKDHKQREKVQMQTKEREQDRGLSL
ncbi:MobV family relaxase [Bacillus tropicus]|uniref:MobV family relaxase n=2 Tax=Bacillus tropicus TaxID=2026188 RepID=UPI003D21AE95